MALLEAALGLGGSFLSGIFGESSARRQERLQRETNAQNLALQREAWAREDKNNAINRGRENMFDTRNWQRTQAVNAQNRSFTQHQVQGANRFTRAERLAAQKFAVGQADRSWQRQMSADNTRVQRLVGDARAAGIHPLAALGANLSSPVASPVSPSYSGGSAGSASGGYSPSMPGGSSVSGLSTQMVAPAYGGNPWGDAIANGLQTLVGLQNNAMQAGLLEAQTRYYNAEASRVLSAARSRTLISGARAASMGGVGGRVDRTVNNYYTLAGGVGVTPTPGRSTYADLAQRYGMLIAEVAGWALGIEDVKNTVKNMPVVPGLREKNIKRTESILGPSPNWDFSGW